MWIIKHVHQSWRTPVQRQQTWPLRHTWPCQTRITVLWLVMFWNHTSRKRVYDIKYTVGSEDFGSKMGKCSSPNPSRCCEFELVSPVFFLRPPIHRMGTDWWTNNHHHSLSTTNVIKHSFRRESAKNHRVVCSARSYDDAISSWWWLCSAVVDWASCGIKRVF